MGFFFVFDVIKKYMYTHVIWGFSIRAQYHTTCRLHETRVNRKMPLSRDMLFSTFKENNYFLKE